MEVGGDNDQGLQKKEENANRLTIDISSNDNTQNIDNVGITNNDDEGKTDNNFSEKSTTNKEDFKNPEEKLCGWLQHRAKGIGNLKMNRQRWFLYSEENCKLYIYRHPMDLCPVGEINIDTASFYFDGGNVDKPGAFEIKTDGKDVFLDAGSRQNMMFWLQALQSKRKLFNLSRGSTGTDPTGHWPQKKQYAGLIGKETETADAHKVFDPGRAGVDVIPEIRLSESEMSGSNSSLNSGPSNRSLSSSIFGFSTIQNALNSIKLPGRTTKEGTHDSKNSVFYDRSSNGFSTSIASSNSNDSLVTIGENGSQSVSSLEEGKGRTQSQLSNCSDGSDTEFLKNQSLSSINRSNTGSWTMIGKNEVQGAQREFEKVDYERNAKSTFYSVEDLKDQDRKLERSESESDSGRTGKILSTFKKLRIGKRQISEPGTTKTRSSTIEGSKDKMPPSQNGQDQSTFVQSDPGFRSMSRSQKDYGDLEEELQANREIVVVLQQQLDVLQKEILSRQKVAELDDEGKTNLLMEKEIMIEDLNKQLSRIQQQHEDTTEKLKSVEEEFTACKEQLAMYEDMLKAKDDTIVGLSQQIFDHEHTLTGTPDQSEPVQHPLDLEPSPGSCEKELHRLQDMCQGYELQHKFLTKEILELNELRKMDLYREKKLTVDYAKLEAKFCQVKSKYFVLLKQHREKLPVGGEADEHDVVNQLIQDAMETDDDDVELRLTGSVQEYDKYGFSRRHFLYEEEVDNDDDLLSNRAAEFERQSEQINTQVKDLEASIRVKWENFMIGRGGKLARSNELKNMIRQGIPDDFRMDVWKGCINLYVGVEREKLGPKYYSSLLQKKKDMTMTSDPSIKQIELDLLRTLPNNKHYEHIESDGVIKLRNVLLAYSEYNKQIGYCQGLNRLAAIALLILDEEDAFWCLVAIVEHILPKEYFSTSLMAAQADQRVLKDLVQDKLPKVHAHLDKHGVDMSLFAFNWFLTVFVDNIPTEMFLRIWDTMLFEKSKVLFRFAVAFLKKCETEILQQDDGLKLNKYLRSIGQKMTDVKLISHYAFTWINPFPMRFLANRRQFHIQQIQVELLELDKIRHGVKMSRQQEQEEDFFSDDDLEM